jgi:hypothetical protein
VAAARYGQWAFAVVSGPQPRTQASGCATTGMVDWDIVIEATWTPPTPAVVCPRDTGGAGGGTLILDGPTELQRVWGYGAGAVVAGEVHTLTHGRRCTSVTGDVRLGADVAYGAALLLLTTVGGSLTVSAGAAVQRASTLPVRPCRACPWVLVSLSLAGVVVVAGVQALTHVQGDLRVEAGASLNTTAAGVAGLAVGGSLFLAGTADLGGLTSVGASVYIDGDGADAAARALPPALTTIAGDLVLANVGNDSKATAPCRNVMTATLTLTRMCVCACVNGGATIAVALLITAVGGAVHVSTAGDFAYTFPALVSVGTAVRLEVGGALTAQFGTLTSAPAVDVATPTLALRAIFPGA